MPYETEQAPTWTRAPRAVGGPSLAVYGPGAVSKRERALRQVGRYAEWQDSG